MKKAKKLSILLASTMIFNLCAFPSIAGASTLDNNTVYAVEGDTKEPAVQAPEAKAQTVLDISRGNIVINIGTVVGLTPSGAAATPNPAGYEIIGKTSTNTITVERSAAPITLNGVTMSYPARIQNAINMVGGGEITVLGTNLIKRTVGHFSDAGLIGHSSGTLTIKGDGTLNMDDYGVRGAVIGGNDNSDTNVIIEGDVRINAYKNSVNDTNEAAVIGASANAGKNTTINIRGNAVVDAKQDGESNAAVIGIGANNVAGKTVAVDIAGSTQVVATGGTKYTRATVIGANNGIDASVAINIQDEALVKVVPRSADFVGTINAPGMGVPAKATISQALKDKTNVYISQFANVDAPAREDYYKSSDQVTAVYKTLINGLTLNSYVEVFCDGNSSRARTDNSGVLFLYLPVGSQRVLIFSEEYTGNVNESGTSALGPTRDGRPTTLDLSKAPIIINRTSVTAQTQQGTPAKFDSDGYEIIGNTTTNTITNNSHLPITLNSIVIQGQSPAIDMTLGGAIAMIGTNTITRGSQYTGERALIEQNSGTIKFTGTGTLNITDAATVAATIGNAGNKVNVNIGRGVGIFINKNGSGAAIGTTNNGTSGTANITIEGGDTRTSLGLKITNASTAQATNAVGMGLPAGAPITSEMIARTTVKVSPGANVDAPARENYYKDPTGNTAVYKGSVATGIAQKKNVNGVYNGILTQYTTFADGGLYLYLPAGEQSVTVDGKGFSGTVDTSGNSILRGGNTLTAANIEKELATTKSLDLTGHAISSAQSPGAITYAITDAGTTGATLTGNTLNWTAAGTAVLKASQAAEGSHDSAETTFNLVVTAPTSDNIRGVLDISKAPITITEGSVTAQTPAGTAATVDPDGYEIVGSTATNTITNNSTLSIALNGITMNGLLNAILVETGGEINLIGTNTITRTSQTSERALIEQNSGTINFTGTGTLNITDEATVGATIGDNNGNQTVSVNVKSGANLNINKNGSGAAIGTTNNGTTGAANITIEDGARVNITNKSTATATNSVGMGLPAGATITSEMIARTTVKVSPRANIEAPARENYYKDLTGNTAVYKGSVAGLAPNANVSVVYDGKTVNTSTFADGGLYLYLPAGEQSVTVDGQPRVGTVDTSGNSIIGLANTLTAANIEKDLATTKSLDLTGHAISSSQSQGAITYAITDAGTTGATLAGNTLNWTAAGTVALKATQAAAGGYMPAETTFNLVVTEPIVDNKRSVLDISKAPITITNNSVTAQTPAGTAATVDPDGYEIVGSTATNTITNNSTLSIALNRITMNGLVNAILVQTGGEINLIGTNTITRTSQTSERALIEQNSGTITFTGTGILNITDEATVGATIGDNNGNQTVSVNVKSGANLNINKNGSGAAIGTTNNGTTGAANITIEDGARVNISNASTAKATNSVGMGLPAGATITSEMIARTTVKVGTFANIEAPARENYYKDLTGTTAVYKVAVAGLAPNAYVSVVYNGTTKTFRTYANGALALYLPVGEQVATIDGERFECVVEDSASNKMFVKTILTAADMSFDVSEGLIGQSLRGHEVTNSPLGMITYTIKDAGTTGATLTKTTLNWNKPGTITMNVSQAESGKYSPASKDFVVKITEANDAIEIEIAVDPDSAKFGKVAVFNSNGKEILPFVPVGETITLKAIPNEGYEVDKWVKTTTTTTRAVTTETLPAVESFQISAQANVGYTVFFKLKDIVKGPKLDVLEVSSMVIQPDGKTVEENKPLIVQDSSESTTFDPDKLVYGLYVRSIDTNKINVYVRHRDTKILNIKIGNTTAVDLKPWNEYKLPMILTGAAYQEIPVVVSNGTDKTTYVIRVFKSQKAETDPHLYSELELNLAKEVLGLGVYAVNTDISSFAMTIKLDELLAADKQAFKAFTSNDGTAFNDINVNLAGNINNYLNLDSRFAIGDMRSDGKFLHLTVNAKPGFGSVNIGNVPHKILTVHVGKNPQYTGELIDAIDTLVMEPVLKGNKTYGNNLSSKFYGGLNDTYNPQDTREEDQKTLSYLTIEVQYDTIKMYIAYDANRVDRVTYEIIEVSNPNKPQLVHNGKVVNREIQEQVLSGKYRVKILAGGYLFAESEDIVYDGVPSEFGIVLTSIRLLEGDLDDNKEINGQDRVKLLSVLNDNVLVSGSGFVALGNENIYADYNNDDRINSLDLGRLVQNMGKQYGIITQN